MKQLFSNFSLKSIVSLLLLWWMMGADLIAQCTQCKAAAAATDENGELIFGGGINTGVLYLLALPILLPFIVGGIWYWKRRQFQKQEAEQVASS